MKLRARLFAMVWVAVAPFLLALRPLAGLASNDLLCAQAAEGER